MSEFVFDVKLDESLFSTEIPEGYQSQTMQIDASLPAKKDFIRMLRFCAENNGGRFPGELTVMGLNECLSELFDQVTPPSDVNDTQKADLQRELDTLLADAKVNLLRLEAIIKGDEKPGDILSLGEDIELNLKGFGKYEERENDFDEQAMEELEQWVETYKKNPLGTFAESYKRLEPISRGVMFLFTLTPDSDWRYAGQGVTLGESNVPIFRYKPKNSDIYRVIYGDLIVREIRASNLPYMPEQEPALPVTKADFMAHVEREQQLSKETEFIRSLRTYTDFCDGHFPDSVELC